MVNKTSLLAYFEGRANRTFQKQERVVLHALRHHPMTREDIAYTTGLRLSSVCGRVKSLLDSNVITTHGCTSQTVSGKPNELVGFPSDLQQHIDVCYAGDTFV